MTPFGATRVDQGDIFLTKLGADGSTVLHTTYIGGRGRDVPLDIALDAGGDLIVVGSTNGLNPEAGIGTGGPLTAIHQADKRVA